MTDPKVSVLVLGLNWLGDIVMSFPALQKAAQATGGSIDVLTRPHLADLYRIHPGVKKVWAVDTRQAFWKFLPMLHGIRQKQYSHILVLPRSFHLAFLAFLCGGKKRTGFSSEGRNFFLHKAIDLPPDFKQWHESKLHEFLVDSAGMGNSETLGRPLPDVRLPEKLKDIPWTLPVALSPKGYVVLAPGAAFGNAKRWPVERFAELGCRLHQISGMQVIVTGSASEAPLTAKAAAAVGQAALDLGGRTSLLELVALLSRARLVVANDSGTMHVASLLRRPLIVPVGSTDMKRTGPSSDQATLIQGDICDPPCRKPDCQRGDHRCMNSIAVERVWQAAREKITHG